MSEFKLRYQIEAENRQFKAAVKESDDMISRLGSSASGALASIGGPGGAAAIATAGIAAVTAAAAAGAATLFNLTKEASDFGSAMFDASQKTGLSAQTISAMTFAAEQSGASLEQITGSLSKYAKTVGAAGEDTKKAAEFMKAFGIEPQEAINDLEGGLGKVFKRIQAAPPGIEKMTLAQKAFGKSGAELLPFIESFDGDLEALIKKAKELGVTLDDDAARASDEFGDSLDTLTAQAKSLGRQIGYELMPWLTELMKTTSEFISEHKGDISELADNSRILLRGVKGYWDDLSAAVQRYIDKVERASGSKLDPAGFGTGSPFLDPKTNPFIKSGADAIRRRGGYFEGEGGGPAEAGGRRLFGGGGDDGPASVGGKAARRAAAPSGDNRTDKQVYQDFVAALKKLGVPITSGFRTYEQQAALYRKLGPGQAARPGTSDHEFYRAVDLPAGVSREILERAARAAGVILEKSLVHQGTGLHNHQAFRKGRAAGGGEAEIEKERAAAAKAAADEAEQLEAGFDKWIDGILNSQKRASDERLSLRRLEAEKTLEILEGQLQRGEITETEYIARMHNQKIDLLERERDELAVQLPTMERTHRLQQISIELSTARIRKENAIDYAIRKQNEALEEQIRKIQESQKVNQRPGVLRQRRGPGEGDGFLDKLHNATGGIKSMDDVMRQLGNTATDVFMQMGAGLGSMLESWVMLGSQAEISMQQMVAAVLGGVASQAATLAIFHLAMGIAALTPWGAAMYGPAPLHFKAAAVWGGVAVGAAVAGRAVAGDSGKAGGKSSRGGGDSEDPKFGEGRPDRDKLDPYSRETNASIFQSGRDRAIADLRRSIDELNGKLGSMRPSDILTRGISEKPGLVTDTVIRESNRGRGAALAKALPRR
jgi:ABC-type transporter Mla subunit MlaD